MQNMQFKFAAVILSFATLASALPENPENKIIPEKSGEELAQWYNLSPRCPCATKNWARTCDTCPTGCHIDYTRLNECEKCATGKVSTGGKQEHCTACTGNTWTSDQKSCIEKTNCVAGEKVKQKGTSSRDRTCESCATGKFSSGTNAASCSDCPSGKWTRDKKSCTAHKNCGAGQEVDHAGSSSSGRTCKSCATGKFSSGTNTASCTACASGKWTRDKKSCTAHTNCEAGQEVDHGGSSSSDRTCKSCASGKFSAGANAASCTVHATCDAGTKIKNQGTTKADRTCVKCGAGMTSSGENNMSCHDIDGCAGNPCHANGDNHASCHDVPAPRTGHKCTCSRGYSISYEDPTKLILPRCYAQQK